MTAITINENDALARHYRHLAQRWSIDELRAVTDAAAQGNVLPASKAGAALRAAVRAGDTAAIARIKSQIKDGMFPVLAEELARRERAITARRLRAAEKRKRRAKRHTK